MPVAHPEDVFTVFANTYFRILSSISHFIAKQKIKETLALLSDVCDYIFHLPLLNTGLFQCSKNDIKLNIVYYPVLFRFVLLLLISISKVHSFI